MEQSNRYFVKEFTPEGTYSIGELIGEPNEDGEQDYRGYYSTDSSLTRIDDREDFISEEDRADLQSNRYPSFPRASTEEDYRRAEAIYNELLSLCSTHGVETRDGVVTEELIEELPEPDRERAEALLAEAYRLIANSKVTTI